MWKPENSRQEILDRLLTRNISHFGQAQGTPFTTNPLLSRFGYHGMSIHGTKLSQSGTIPSGIDNISTATRDVIERKSPDILYIPIYFRTNHLSLPSKNGRKQRQHHPRADILVITRVY
jgi:hypothetical protein